VVALKIIENKISFCFFQEEAEGILPESDDEVEEGVVDSD
jgi:hypothetical protein